MNSTKQRRLLYLYSYFCLTVTLILFLKPLYFYSIIIVLVPPALMNFIWLKKSKKKILIFSLFSTALFAPPIELATRLANVWDVQSIFFRPFGLIPLENMLFAFINIFWGLSFYEYFVDRDLPEKISKRFRYLLVLYIILAVFVYGFYFYNKNLISINYFTMSVPILIIPAIYIFSRNPGLLKKTILPTVFFAVVFFLYELISLRIGSWWWPGEYFYTFMIDGNKFPLDDIIIWYFLSTPTLIAGYEFFADDFK